MVGLVRMDVTEEVCALSEPMEISLQEPGNSAASYCTASGICNELPITSG